ncbi:AAA-like domain-containing protein [Phormidesmis sp. 146-35]
MVASQLPVSRYQVGGSLPPNAPSYVKRRADDDLYVALQQREFCYVFNARQMGKSSLRVQTMQRLREEGIFCGVIDITAIGTQQVTAEQWYASIAASLVSNFQLKVNLGSWWRDRTHLSLVNRLSDFLETILLAQVTQDIVIFIDEIDSVLGLKFPTDDFFALIRACYNKRAEQAIYNHLSFALLGVATPTDLITDKTRTPFNIGQAIELDGFQLSEAAPLLPDLISVVSYPKAVLQQILNWTGGQPFLTQKMCQIVVQELGGAEPAAQSTQPLTARLEHIFHSRIIHNWETQDEPEHLRTIRDRLLRNQPQSGRLLGLYQQILLSPPAAPADLPTFRTSHQGIPADGSREQGDLLLSGLVEKHQGQLRIKNPIYEAVFNLEWVERQLAKRRPYAEALTGWLNSGCADDSRLLRGQTLLDAQLWARGKSLSDQDYQFLAASQDRDRQEVQKTLEAERLKEVQARLKEQRTHLKRQRSLLALMSVLLVVAIGLAMATFWQSRQATLSEIRASATSSDALYASDRRFDALMAAIQSKRRLQTVYEHDPETEEKVETALQRSIYGVVESNRFSVGTGVLGVAFSPDGQTIASSDSDNAIKLWRPDGTLLKDLHGHGGAVYKVTFSADGQTIASASLDNTVNLWKRDKTGSFTTPYRTLRGHVGPVWDVAFSPNGQLVASASADNTIKLWRSDGTLILTLKSHNSPVWSVAFSPDGGTIASASADNTIQLWRQDAGKFSLQPFRTLLGHEAAVLGVAYSPDGAFIASGSEDNTVKLWRSDGTLLHTLRGHTAGVNEVAFSLDSQLIASTSVDNTVKLWKRDGSLLTTLKGHLSGVYSVDFSRDGLMLATAGADSTVRLWKPRSTLLKTLNGHSSVVWGVAFSSDGQTIASAGSDKSVKLWKPDGTVSKTLKGHSAAVNKVAFSPDTAPTKILASASDDTTIRLWKLDGTALKTFKGHGAGIMAIKFSPDGRTIASGSDDTTIKLWKLDGTLLQTLQGHKARILDLAFSPDGRWLASAAGDGKVQLWKQNSAGQFLSRPDKTLLNGSSTVWGVQFSPTGEAIVSTDSEGTIQLWTQNGQGQFLDQPRKLTSGSHALIRVDFNPTGQVIAASSMDGTVKLWSINGTLLTTLTGHRGTVWDVAFSHNGRLLASASDDQTVILWDLYRILNLDLLKYGCDWARDYLRTNGEVEARDRSLCEG